MNIAEHIEYALWPLWLVDPSDVKVVNLRPGAIVQVQHVECVQTIGGAPPAWEWARRMIEGPDA
jgi:hypothetical protein